jgi:taurine dioxygenase
MALSTETEVTSGIRGSSTDVVPTGAALGATVKGVDLKDHVVSRSAAEGEHALLP